MISTVRGPKAIPKNTGVIIIYVLRPFFPTGPLW